MHSLRSHKLWYIIYKLPFLLLFLKGKEKIAKVLLPWVFHSTCSANMHRFFFLNKLKTKQAFSRLMSYFDQNKFPKWKSYKAHASITMVLYIFSEALQCLSNRWILLPRAKPTVAANILITVFFTSNHGSTQEPSKQATWIRAGGKEVRKPWSLPLLEITSTFSRSSRVICSIHLSFSYFRKIGEFSGGFHSGYSQNMRAV